MTKASAPLLRLDLHNHTHGSWDCLTDPDALLERAVGRGLDRIGITDHNKLDVALDMHRRHPDRIIPGEEVKTAEGIDLIGFFIEEEIPKGTPAEEVCERVRSEGGLLYLPHPFAHGKGGGGRFAEMLAPKMDIIEVFNARMHPGRLNAPALALAEKHGKPGGAGSDAHTLREIAGAWVEVPDHENTPEGLLAALSLGSVRGRTAPLWIHLASTWAKVRKRLGGVR